MLSISIVWGFFLSHNDITSFIVPTSKYEFPTIRETYLSLSMRIKAKGFAVQIIIYSKFLC